jgi:hypothetical protein
LAQAEEWKPESKKSRQEAIEAREHLALLYAFEFHQLDLAAAQFEQLIACPNLPPKQTVHWLNQLADVQVRIGGDLAAAEATLKRILALYPGSAFAAHAEARIMTLPNELRGQRESAPIKMGEYDQRLGLKMKPRPPGMPKI